MTEAASVTKNSTAFTVPMVCALWPRATRVLAYGTPSPPPIASTKAPTNPSGARCVVTVPLEASETP